MFTSCMTSVEIFCSSLDEEGIFPGISDIVAVMHKQGDFKSSGFFVCFGPHRVIYPEQSVSISVNKVLINSLKFDVDNHGYVHPYYPTPDQLKAMNLRWGYNSIEFQLGQATLQAQIYLLADNDKIVVSDVDGTLTKNDVGGIINNVIGRNYVHQGYTELIQKIKKNGYEVVWLTMRSLPLYRMSKEYIDSFIKIKGALITEPQQFTPALKKQITKKTGNIKANIMRNIKELFPVNAHPFAGGLGNRQNDAIAYLAAGIPLQAIFIVDPKSQVQKMDSGLKGLTYTEMAKDVQKYFPKYNAPKIGYKYK